VLVLGGADHLWGRDRERLVGTLLDERGRDEWNIGDAGSGTGAVLAIAHVVNTREEHRRRADHRKIIPAGLDLGVLGLVGVQLRIEEVNHQLAACQPAVRVDVLREALHGVSRTLEQVWRDRIVDVGHDRDVDLFRRDADVGRLGSLFRRPLRSRAGRRTERHDDRRHQSDPANTSHLVPP
jgi:hypothetical protein